MVLFFIACVTPPPGETIDIVEGDYVGELEQGDMLEDVVIVEAGTALRVVLYEDDDVLWAESTITGKLTKGLVVIDGPDTELIEGVTIEGVDLACTLVTPNVVLEVTGFFVDDFTTLFLDVDTVGVVTLDLVTEDE